MKSHSQYNNERTLYAYDKYIKGEIFEKARAVILKDGKVAYIRDLTTGYVTIPGGGVDENETKEQAVIRETKEETGIDVKIIKPIETILYDVDMSFGNINFVSKRAAYIFLCDYVKEEKGYVGLDGEYDGKVEVYFDDIEKLSECRVSKEAIETLKEYIENASNNKQ